jgi:hypothetical protein
MHQRSTWSGASRDQRSTLVKTCELPIEMGLGVFSLHQRQHAHIGLAEPGRIHEPPQMSPRLSIRSFVTRHTRFREHPVDAAGEVAIRAGVHVAGLRR